MVENLQADNSCIIYVLFNDLPYGCVAKNLVYLLSATYPKNQVAASSNRE